MAIYKLDNAFIPLQPATYASLNVLKRKHLQQFLKANIAVVAPDVLIISEEFKNWDDANLRVDLLGVDREANLVIIELKRDEKGGHMELQAIRYAAMVANMTFSQAVDAYASLLQGSATGPGVAERAEAALLDWLEWDEPREDAFAQDIRITLVSADFSKEVTTAVLWLNERDLDVRCVRLKPYSLEGSVFVDVQQVIPLPEASEYQIGVREKAIVRRESARQQAGGPTGYWFSNVGDGGDAPHRSWTDCTHYGFMTAGGGLRFRRAISKLAPGDKFFAYASGSGYVGFGEVVAAAVRQRDFVPPGQSAPLANLPMEAELKDSNVDDDHCEWFVAVKWFGKRKREDGRFSKYAHLQTLGRIKQADVVADLLAEFQPTPE